MQLQAEVEVLTAKVSIAEKQAALTEARFGKPASTPTGAIENQKELLAFGQWALADVYDTIKKKAGQWKGYAGRCASGYFVTSTPNRGEKLTAAQVVNLKIQEYTNYLREVQSATPAAHGPSPQAALPAAVAALTGLVGSADKLVGLFRSDYVISDASASIDPLAARFAAATGLKEALGEASTDARIGADAQRSADPKRAAAPTSLAASSATQGGGKRKGEEPENATHAQNAPEMAAHRGQNVAGANPSVIVEGLVQHTSEGPLLKEYGAFFRELLAARQRYASAAARATTETQKAALASDNALITAAGAFDTALTTAVEGTVPLVNMADELESATRCSLVVHVSGLKTSLITRKRLLSRNDDLIAVSGGTVLMMLFDPNGAVLADERTRIDRRLTGRLDEIVKASTKIMLPKE